MSMLRNRILKYNKILYILLIFGITTISPSSSRTAENVNDPFEKVNRNIFKLNNNLDDYCWSCTFIFIIWILFCYK